jgi:hypothetical protein
MSRLILAGLMLVAGAAMATPARAQKGLAAGAHAGTLGPGLEVVTGVLPSLNVRVIGNYLPYSISAEVNDLDVAVAYDADLQLLSFGALADWFPFANQIRATAGLVYNRNNAAATIRPIEDYEMNGRVFAPDRVGDLSAEVDYKSSIAPYLGVGLGNPLTRRVSFVLDLGVMYTSAPAVRMSGNGMIAPTAQQAPELEEGVSSFQWWPVLNLGFNVNLTGRR